MSLVAQRGRSQLKMSTAKRTGFVLETPPPVSLSDQSRGILLGALCKLTQTLLLLWVEKWLGLLATLHRVCRLVNHVTSVPSRGREANILLVDL